jgi:hypothetical protein
MIFSNLRSEGLWIHFSIVIEDRSFLNIRNTIWTREWIFVGFENARLFLVPPADCEVAF